jgi:DNA-binding transcriptional LysR family regulator
MSKFSDLESLAIFAKIAKALTFVAAARLKLCKATVSKAVSRPERKLKTWLFNRTSRRVALTDAGWQLAGAHILAEGEAAEDAALAQATVPHGLAGLAVPMSFRLLNVASVLPEFGVIGEVSTRQSVSLLTPPLVVRRLCEMQRCLVGPPI